LEFLKNNPLTASARGVLITPQSFFSRDSTMKVSSSLKSLKNRHPNCQVVRRRGRVYVINKTHPRYKARQG